MTYTEKELNQFLHGISMSLLSKKSAQHWRYDEETAKEIEWLEALERKVRADEADRKTENCSEIPNNSTISKMEQVDKDINVRSKGEPRICDTCRYYNSYIPCGSTPSACKEADKFAEEFVDGLKKLKPTISKMEQVDKDINVRSKDCTTCRHAGEVYEDPCELCYRHSHYEPKDEPQTGRNE